MARITERPVRKTQTVADVQESFRKIKQESARVAIARAMLKVGNLTDEAKEYVAREYSDRIAIQYGNDA